MKIPKYFDEITVIDPDTKLPVEVELYKDSSGGIFAVDASYLDQVIDIYVYNPFTGEPIFTDDLECVAGCRRPAVELTLNQIKHDVEMGDFTAIEELLKSVPLEAMKAFISDED